MHESLASPDPVDGVTARYARWRRAGTFAVIVVGAGFAFTERHELPATWSALRHARGPWLVTGVAVSMAMMVAFSLARKRALDAFGIAISTESAITLGFMAHALNTLGKSGGMAGAVVYRRDARQRGHAVATTTAAYVLTAVLVNIAFACVVLLAMGILIIHGQLSVGVVIAGVIFAVYLIAVFVVFLGATRSQHIVRRLYSIAPRIMRRESRGHESQKQANRQAADDLHLALQTVRTRPRAILPVFVWLLVVEALNVATVAVALAAYGQHKSIAVSIIAYAVTGLLAIVDPLPIGLAEASLAAVLVRFNVPGSTAAVVVITQRLLEIWLPVAIGLATKWRLRIWPTGIRAR